jgi:hypothetical protein
MKRFDATKIHTYTFSLDDLPTALHYAKDRIDDAIKVVVKTRAVVANEIAARWFSFLRGAIVSPKRRAHLRPRTMSASSYHLTGWQAGWCARHCWEFSSNSAAHWISKKQRFNLGCRARRAKEISLHLRAALRPQQAQLLPGLDPFRRGGNTEAFAKTAMARTIAMDSSRFASSRINDWSILILSNGKLCK